MAKSIRIRIMHSGLKVHETITAAPLRAIDADVALGAIGSGPLRRRYQGETTGTVSLSPLPVRENLRSKAAREAIASLEDDALRGALQSLSALYAEHWSPEGFIALASVRED